MPSPPRLSASTSPFADISQPRKLLVPQSTATKAGAAVGELVASVKLRSCGTIQSLGSRVLENVADQPQIEESGYARTSKAAVLYNLSSRYRNFRARFHEPDRM